MALLRSFSVLGDSNLKRHMSPTATSGRPQMSSAKIILCGRMSTFGTSLSSISLESDACIIACLTNFLTSASGSISSVSTCLRPVIKTFFEKIVAAAAERPGTQFFVCPPMYRTTPLWYRDGLPEVMQLFSSSVPSVRPSNLWLMPSFPNPQLESDGVHLTPFSGIEYVVHLFNSSETVFTNSRLDEASKVDLVLESSRSLSDRVTVIERDHARLSKSFEMHTAVNAEFVEFQENVRNEAFIMIQGLPRLPKVDQKEWQLRACAGVDQVLAELGFGYKVLYVQNLTGRGNASRTLYKARLESVAASKEVRDKFSGFFAGGKDTRPATLAGVSIRNCVTSGTLARIAIMQLLGKRYKDSNPGARFQMIAYESRPILKLIPPEGSSSRVMVFNYIEAISKLPTNFDKDEIDGLLKRISPRLFGSLRETFVVLSQDMLAKKKTSASKRSPVILDADADVASESESTEFRTPDGSSQGSSQGRKRGRSNQASGSGPASKK